MANELNEGEGIGTTSQTVPGAETQFRDDEHEIQEGEEGEVESTAGTWAKDAMEWIRCTVRDRPLGALLIVAGASLVTGVVTGTLLKSPKG